MTPASERRGGQIATTHGNVFEHPSLTQFGLNSSIIREAVHDTHKVLDTIDDTLLSSDGNRLATMIELANFSAIIGNLFRTGVSRASKGAFKANRPHTYPDLLAVAPGATDLEIKVALEKNNPKGHLVKPGAHVTVRYVLAKQDGEYMRGIENRGTVAWIWEVRVGYLEDRHFNFSSTTGDSGKTAVVNAAGMKTLHPIFIDLEKCPLSPNGPLFRPLAKLQKSVDAMPGYLRQ